MLTIPSLSFGVLLKINGTMCYQEDVVTMHRLKVGPKVNLLLQLKLVILYAIVCFIYTLAVILLASH